MRNTLLNPLLLLLAAFLYGCYPQGAEFVDELDLVVTVENTDINYDDYQTYVIPDTIMFLTNSPGNELDGDQQALILGEVESMFQIAGWSRSINPSVNGSDVLITVTILDNLTVGVIDGWWDYWGGWPGWGWYPPYPGGGWYPWYPGYPGLCCYSSIYSYRQGTLIIEMMDPNDGTVEGDSDSDPLPVLWSGAINGLLQDRQANINNRIDQGLKQMLEDSPYLQK